MVPFKGLFTNIGRPNTSMTIDTAQDNLCHNSESNKTEMMTSKQTNTFPLGSRFIKHRLGGPELVGCPLRGFLVLGSGVYY